MKHTFIRIGKIALGWVMILLALYFGFYGLNLGFKTLMGLILIFTGSITDFSAGRITGDLVFALFALWFARFLLLKGIKFQSRPVVAK